MLCVASLGLTDYGLPVFATAFAVGYGLSFLWNFWQFTMKHYDLPDTLVSP